MTDQELADRIVALGVGEMDAEGVELDLHHKYLYDDGFSKRLFSARMFEHSWAIAGALIEKCADNWLELNLDRKVRSKATYRCWIDRHHSGTETETYHGRSSKFPHAIILACVEALEAT